MASSSRYRDDKLIAKIGKLVRAARTRKEVSQQKLAHLCEVELSTINRIELGKINPTISTLYLIAEKLEINPSEILIIEE